MINQVLAALGLDQDEVKTYLLLLETGSITVGALAKKLGLPRSSLYGFLKRLQDQGLVSQSLKSGVKIFFAEAPEKINFLFSQRIEELQKKHEIYKEVLPELRKHHAAKFLVPKLQLFEGEDGLKNVLKDMLLYNNMETQAFWPQKKMVESLTADFFRYHNKERVKNNLFTRAIWPQNQMVEIKKYPYFGVGEKFKREIRVAPEQIDFTMGYWIYGSRAAFISSRQESFGFIIESAEFVQMLLAQFEIIWNMSTPLKVSEQDAAAFVKELDYHLGPVR